MDVEVLTAALFPARKGWDLGLELARGDTLTIPADSYPVTMEQTSTIKLDATVAVTARGCRSS